MPFSANDQIHRAALMAVTPNILLARLGATAEATLRQAGRTVAYRPGERIFSEGAPATQVLFVEQGAATLHWADLEGATAEVDLVAQDGAIGLLETLARGRIAFDVRAELPVEGLLVPADAVRQLAETSPAAAVAFWTHALHRQTQVRRSVGCASRHGARARLADYLLAIDSLSPGRRLPLTQEGLGSALGVYRTTVTALVAGLVEARVVASGRGWLRIIDRPGLSQIACGCRARTWPAGARGV